MIIHVISILYFFQGVAHIKFWKMCNTFTGLKLKGEVGRFGKTEYTDIVGVIPMPDEKVTFKMKHFVTVGIFVFF